MKSFILFVATLFVSSLVYAQADVAYLGKGKTPSKQGVFANRQVNPDLFFEHNYQAMLALRNHFSKNIRYPETLQRYGMEGSAMVEIRISEWGRVEQVKVLKGSSPAFDEAIMAALDSLDYVFAEGQKYRGWRKMQLPVVFSMR